MVTKNNNRKDLKVNEIDDRRQLSKDQIELISELRDMITGQRSDINKLRNEIKQLQNVNFNLTLENLHLQGKIDKLTERLQIFEENNEIKEAREMKDKGEDLE